MVEDLNVSHIKRCFTVFVLSLFISNTIYAASNNKVTNGRLEPEYTDPVTGMEFVLVQGGSYEMGDTFGDGEIDELPVHEVIIDDFYIGKYEVTNSQFRRFVLETGYKTSAENVGKGYAVSKEGADDRGLKSGVNWMHPLWPYDNIAKKLDHPVLQVSWFDAVQFIRWLNRKSGKKFRLPTEAQWEYAARDRGKQNKYTWSNGKPDDNISDESVKKFREYKYWEIWDGYNDGYVYTSPVGKFKPNGLGIYDMAGNVSEWCHDLYDGEYYKKNNSKDNPEGPQIGNAHVVRGGSWNYKPFYLRNANRIFVLPDNWSYYLGFRLVMEP